MFKKEQIVIYLQKKQIIYDDSVYDDPDFVSEEPKIHKVPVRIVGVHYDDYPNIYYTIKPVRNDATFEEKQTDESRLVQMDAKALAALENSKTSGSKKKKIKGKR